jgi:transposase
MIEEEAIKQKFELLAGELNERTLRLTAAVEALALGWGGISAVARATGVSQRAIRQGIKELKAERVLSQGRIRRAGGGRKKTANKDESLCEDLERLMEPVARGELESPLRWTCKSVRKLAAELEKRGHQVSYQLVSELLHDLGYSLQAYRELREGGDYSLRDEQFTHLNELAKAFVSTGEPVVSIDIKKRELLGDDTNSGLAWSLKGESEEVCINDFPSAGSAWMTPYSVFDPARNAGWKNVGFDHDTVAFAVESLRRWWNEAGQSQYPRARQLLISTNGGVSNGPHAQVWKWGLQRLADETRIAIKFCYLPSGTSKWNNIEHRLFAWISQNFRVKPLTSYAVIFKMIGVATSEAELIVHYQLDTNPYPAGRKVSDEDKNFIWLRPEFFDDEWNYFIVPHDHYN